MTFDETVEHIHQHWRRYGSPEKRQQFYYESGYLAGIDAALQLHRHAKGDCKCQTAPSSQSSPQPSEIQPG